MFSARAAWLRSSHFHRRQAPAKAVNPDAVAEMWHPDTGGNFILCPLGPDTPDHAVEPEYELAVPIPAPPRRPWWRIFR
jgi:hypothetical protein